jgi:nucleotide sugar dehydrogenase
MEKNKSIDIGIVGQGYVGSAIKHTLKKSFTINTFDKFIKEKSTHDTIQSLVEESDIIFLCLPTPMNEDGSCHIDIVEKTLTLINDSINEGFNKKIVVIKSTIPPGTTKKFQLLNQNIDIVYNPEFLREASFIEDFKKQKFIILGGEKYICDNVANIYNRIFKGINIIITNYETAEMTKNLINSFLATKVSFANEMKLLCDQLGINYSDMIEIAKNDKRIGLSHWDVPGHDGELGFGGSCFPKDIQSIVNLAESVEIDTKVLKAAIETNHTVRPVKDWEKLKGRTVVKK